MKTYFFLLWLIVLTLISFFAKSEIDYLRERESITRSEISALIMRVDFLEEQLFLSGKEVNDLAEKILDVCLTDGKRINKERRK